jgi:hypothetical protein
VGKCDEKYFNNYIDHFGFEVGSTYPQRWTLLVLFLTLADTSCAQSTGNQEVPFFSTLVCLW